MSTKLSRNNNHNYFMGLALKQARINLGNTKKNPSVGCVIVKNNSLLSASCTGFNGTPHAESSAIKNSKTNLENSTLYSTLEPCSHYGKTPPCINLISKRKIKSVYYSIKDPDIRSFNKCKKRLSKKKIIVKNGYLARDLNLFYSHYIKYKSNLLPYVTAKLAVSKDFFTINKKNKWITNKYSRGRVHLMRSQHDCIITSSKTINKDNPQLNCRINGLERRSPARIILDKKLDISTKSKIIREAASYKTVIFYNLFNKKKIKFLNKFKVKTYRIPLDINGSIDLVETLKKAKTIGFSRIFLESGLELTNSFLQSNLVDDLKIFISKTKLNKNGKYSAKKSINIYLKNKNNKIEKINLFGDRLISCNLK